MPRPPVRVLLWTDAPGPYAEAIGRAGLSGRVAAEAPARAEAPSAGQLAETGAMLAWGAPAGLLPRMPKLRWVQALTAGVEGWLALPDLPGGVALTCARGTHRESMPENILGALFHLAKPYAAIVEDQKRRRWTRRVPEPLNGKTLGILGLGAVGREVAWLAGALGMRAVGTRRGGAPPPGPAAEAPPPGRTDGVPGRSDLALPLLPATPETEGFMGAERPGRTRPGARPLDFGRGQLVADGDPVRAARDRVVAGAALDAFRREPLPEGRPFWTAGSIAVPPHAGGPHPRRGATVADLFAGNLARFPDGRPLREAVDRRRGY